MVVILDFLQFLKKHPETRKVFGKRELKIIEKQLYGVSLTQSEKNRLSRDMRKKCEFIKEAEKFASEFDLKKGEYIKKSAENRKMDDEFFWEKGIYSGVLFEDFNPSKQELEKASYIVLPHPVKDIVPEKIIGNFPEKLGNLLKVRAVFSEET